MKTLIDFNDVDNTSESVDNTIDAIEYMNSYNKKRFLMKFKERFDAWYTNEMSSEEFRRMVLKGIPKRVRCKLTMEIIQEILDKELNWKSDIDYDFNAMESFVIEYNSGIDKERFETKEIYV